MNLETSRPTHVRHLVVFVTMLTSILLYLDRFCISFAERFIREDLGLENRQIAWMLSAFFWTYGLAQVPSGWLSDRFGARRMLTLYVLLWSLFTGLSGLAMSFTVLIALRFGFGAAQAGAYPTSAGLLSKWAPFAERGTASSMIGVAGRVGGAVAPVLTAYLIVLFVPVRVSSRLQPADLLAIPSWCHSLIAPSHYDPQAAPPKPGTSAAGHFGWHLLGALDAETRAVVRDVGSEHTAAIFEADAAARSAGRGSAVPPVRAVDVTAEQRRQLADGLNHVLERRDLYRESDFREIALPGEAKKLIAQPAGERSAAETERLNRLLLEAAFPDAIRKVYVAGWRQVMGVFGAVGLLVAAGFWWCFRDRPREHARCNAAEVAIIEHGRPVGSPSPHGAVGGIPFDRLIASRSLWMSCVSQFGTNFGWVFLVSWLPRYLQEVHRVPVEARGWLSAMPLVVGMCGGLSGGRLTDWLVGRVGLRWGRGLPMAASRFVAMAAFLACLLPLSAWTATAAFAVVAFSTDIGSPAVWAFKQDVGGRHVGSVLGWGNMWGNFGAAISPLVLNQMVESYKNWNAAFLMCAAAFFLSGVAACGVDATIPIAPQDGEQSA